MANDIYRIEVWLKPHIVDGRAEGLMADIASLGYALDGIAVTELYFLQGDLRDDDVERLCRHVLYDPVSQSCRWDRLADGNVVESEAPSSARRDTTEIEVTLHPGVTDSVAESIIRGANTIGIAGITQAAAGSRFTLQGELSAAQAQHIAKGLLCNTVIQHFTLGSATPPFVRVHRDEHERKAKIVPVLQADDRELQQLSRQRLLSLNLEEMRAIQVYFRREGRDPLDAELETIAQTWSEHCNHKTFRGTVDYEEHRADGTQHQEQIVGLLNTYLRKATDELQNRG